MGGGDRRGQGRDLGAAGERDGIGRCRIREHGSDWSGAVSRRERLQESPAREPCKGASTRFCRQTHHHARRQVGPTPSTVRARPFGPPRGGRRRGGAGREHGRRGLCLREPRRAGVHPRAQDGAARGGRSGVGRHRGGSGVAEVERVSWFSSPSPPAASEDVGAQRPAARWRGGAPRSCWRPAPAVDTRRGPKLRRPPFAAAAGPGTPLPVSAAPSASRSTPPTCPPPGAAARFAR
ncbi:hypothetical protein SEVIR_7G314850v4 [Setaria viridis]|uniref:Uncharacterized protein n=1 Tax=Setaria viridis TaxID=4556 RepID=A0A4U6UB88_SETVI|nr:hypothetical protein SEVIR_7G314850v2 [Setaria viridis]